MSCIVIYEAPNNITNISEYAFHVLSHVADIIGLYVITAICGIGVVTNFCFLIVLSHKSLKHKFYENMWVKTFCDWIVCLIGVGYLNNSSSRFIENARYWCLFYKMCIIKMPLRVALVSSTLAEIYLILNRCVNLFNPTSKLLYFNKWLALFCIQFVSACIFLPFYLMIDIKQSSTSGEYTVGPKGILPEVIYSNYRLFISVIINIVSTVILIVLNLISVIKFRQRIAASIMIRKNFQSAGDKLEWRFTKMVIILSVLFISCKAVDHASNLISNSESLDEVPSFREKSIVNFSRQISYLFNFSFHVFNSLLYINMDSNLRKIVSRKIDTSSQLVFT